MKLFRLEDYTCVVNKEEVFLIPEFKKLFELKYNAGEGDHDGRKRKRAYSELTYVHFMYSHTSEYKEYDKEERHIQALEAAGLPKDHEISPELQGAIDRYNSLQDTRLLKLLRSAENAIDKTRRFFDEIDYAAKNNAGNLLYEPNKVMGTIGGLSKSIEALEKLERKVKLDLEDEHGNRGDKELGRIK